jgi:DNA-directed RNA polymerase specialized sigma subunit
MDETSEGCEALDWLLDKLSAAKKKEPPKSTFVTPPKLEVKADLTKTKASELELWKNWKNGGKKPEDLDPLFKSFARLINKRVNLYRGRVELPISTIEHAHKLEFVNAMNTFDPTKGAALGTHVHNRLLKGGRFIETNKNFSRISENVGKNIGAFNAVKANLTDQLGHEPDDQTIHDYLLVNPLKTNNSKYLSMKDIQRLNKDQRKGLIHTDHDTADLGGAPNLSSREEEIIHLVHHELSPQERLVHEYTFGLHGKPVLAPGAMAKKLKMDGPKISKLKKSIREKILSHMEE